MKLLAYYAVSCAISLALPIESSAATETVLYKSVAYVGASYATSPPPNGFSQAFSNGVPASASFTFDSAITGNSTPGPFGLTNYNFVNLVNVVVTVGGMVFEEDFGPNALGTIVGYNYSGYPPGVATWNSMLDSGTVRGPSVFGLAPIAVSFSTGAIAAGPNGFPTVASFLSASANFVVSFGAASGNTVTVQMNTSPLPEPVSLAFMLAGVGIIGIIARRNRPSK